MKGIKITGTIKPDQYNWMHKMIEDGRYYNVSHIIQKGIGMLQKKELKR